MKDRLAEDKDYKLWSLLHQTRSALFKVREKEISKYGITAAQSAALFIINVLRDKATPSLISKGLIRESHTTYSLLSRMEKLDLIKKARGPKRRSETVISLTEKGHQAYRQITNIDLIREMMSCLSEEERQVMYSCLKKLRDEALSHLVEIRNVPYP